MEFRPLFPVTDDGLAYVMSNTEKVSLIDAISEELNRIPQSGNLAVLESLEFLSRRLNRMIDEVKEWQQNGVAQ